MNKEINIKLYLFLKKIERYEVGLFYKIKEQIFYKFKDNEELENAVELYTNKKTFECALYLYNHISLWNTSKITNMGHLFAYKNDFNENINSWDVSNV